MASIFGDLPTAGLRHHTRSGTLVASTGSGSVGERALQWVYDDETANCMHCNTPFTMITRKVYTLSLRAPLVALSVWLMTDRLRL